MKHSRKQTTITLPEYLLADLRTEAARLGTSVSRLLEEIAGHHLYHPNADTLAALDEAKSGAPMEEIPQEAMESIDKFLEYANSL